MPQWSFHETVAVLPWALSLPQCVEVWQIEEKPSSASFVVSWGDRLKAQVTYDIGLIPHLGIAQDFRELYDVERHLELA